MRSNERKKEEHQACLIVTDFLSENAAKPHSEMKRSGIERVASSSNLIFSGGDAFRGNTRPHPEHDG